jgi:hypothetical protein
MESVKKIAVFIVTALVVFSCKSVSQLTPAEDPLVLTEITPLPKTIVIKAKEEYEPVYGLMRVLEISEENGVQKYLLAKTGDIKTGLSAGVSGDISADASFGEIIGTFKIREITNGFVRCVIESVTQKVPATAYIRIQTGQKLKGE